MSQFKAYKSFLIDIGNTPKKVKEEIKGHILGAGWRMLAETDTTFDIIPSSTVGNSVGNDILRVAVTPNSITFKPCISNVDFTPHYYEIFVDANYYLSNWGNKLIISVDGVQEEVVAVNGKSFTSVDDFRNYLCAKLNATLSTKLNKFTFSRSPWDSRYIIAQEKTQDAYNYVLTTNTSSMVKWEGYLPNTIVERRATGDSNYNPSVTIDLASGFIYYLSIHERTISLATKTTASYSPIICASFMNNAVVSASCPQGCFPVELILTFGKGSGWYNSYPDASVLTTHIYSYIPAMVSTSYPPRKVASKQRVSNFKKFFDSVQPPDAIGVSYCPLRVIWTGFNYAQSASFDVNTFKNLVASSPVINPYFTESMGANTGGGYPEQWGVGYVPGYVLEDIYFFAKDATEESLHLSQDFSVTTAVTSDVAASDLEIQVGDTSAFPAAGTITIDAEIIEYTGKTATSFTGCSRGKYGTTAAGHITTANIYVLYWFTKIGQQVMMAGYTRPTG